MEECCVCYNYTNHIISCGHCVCKDCIQNMYIKSNKCLCPLCRRTINIRRYRHSWNEHRKELLYGCHFDKIIYSGMAICFMMPSILFMTWKYAFCKNYVTFDQLDFILDDVFLMIYVTHPKWVAGEDIVADFRKKNQYLNSDIFCK